jgi:hypothetical protein
MRGKVGVSTPIKLWEHQRWSITTCSLKENNNIYIISMRAHFILVYMVPTLDSFKLVLRCLCLTVPQARARFFRGYRRIVFARA